MEFLDFTFWGNTGREYLMAVGVFVVAYILLKILQVSVLRKLKKWAALTETDVDDLVVGLFRHLKPPFYLTVSIYLALRTLTLSGTFKVVIDKLVLAVIIIYLTFLVAEVVTYIINRFMKEKEVSHSVAGIMSSIARGAVWVFAILTILANLGVNVTSLIAGLGIGGVAIAFAFKNILEDIFSAFSIFMDKPFAEGDTIVIGSDRGKVEEIGIKTTKLRSSQGEQIIVSNREVTAARISNMGRMERRRQVTLIGATYETPREKLEKIPKMMEEIVSTVEGVSFDRAHFINFGPSSLDFELAYYVDEYSKYKNYLDIVQRINFGLVEAFEREGIEFAYPTQTLYLKK